MPFSPEDTCGGPRSSVGRSPNSATEEHCWPPPKAAESSAFSFFYEICITFFPEHHKILEYYYSKIIYLYSKIILIIHIIFHSVLYSV